MYVYSITDDVIDRCKQFAESSSYKRYSSRGQYDDRKKFKDILYGKLGEWGFYYIKLSCFPHLSTPDMNIYSIPQKSWKPDLCDPLVPINIGVKTQDIESKINWGESWVFQNSSWKKFGKIIDSDTEVFTDDIDPNYYVGFMLLNFPKRTVELRALVKLQFLHDNKLFKPMRLERLQNNKVAVYYSDLEKFDNQLFQI
jgi:hypothetical protein